MKRSDLFISLALNLFNFTVVTICTILTFMYSASSIKMFTLQSNMMCGVVALIIVVFEILILLKKIDKLPVWLKTIKMVTNTGVFLTLVVVVFFLGFVAIAEGYSYFILFQDENLFFHFLTPLIAVISFTFFEKGDDIKFKYTFFNIIHMVLYANFYVINVMLELIKDDAIKRYDWYYFFAIDNNFLSFLIIFFGVILTYGLGFIMWFINRKLYKKEILANK